MAMSSRAWMYNLLHRIPVAISVCAIFCVILIDVPCLCLSLIDVASERREDVQ